MGIVYEGWDPQLDRRVAIKIVRLPAGGSSEAVETHLRFKREAQAAGRLTHPNIVGIYDYRETGDLAYIVMEYVEGEALKAVLDRGERLPLRETVRLIEDLLAGLQFSHDRGVVHRDIKPANVMLAKDGRVKISDFGIARIESSSTTQVGMVMGTPAYMSPEQIMGQPVDKRTDIYSTGVLLYQLLTGERPFEGSTTGIMHKALNTTPPRPSDVSVAAPPSFDAIVARAMSRRPGDRYPDAAAFGADLRRAFEPRAMPFVSTDADDATIHLRLGSTPAEGLTAALPVKPVSPVYRRQSGSTRKAAIAWSVYWPKLVRTGRRLEQRQFASRWLPAKRSRTFVLAASGIVGLALLGAATSLLMRPAGQTPRMVVAEHSTMTPSAEKERGTPAAGTEIAVVSRNTEEKVAMTAVPVTPPTANPAAPLAPSPPVTPAAVRPAPSPPMIQQPQMVLLPGGRFQMGSREDPSEEPAHFVQVRPFWISKYPVTISEWRACVAADGCDDIPNGTHDPDEPMNNVSWLDAMRYVKWLARASGLPYRLPSEAEWEYAARAGSTTRYWWGDKLEMGQADCHGCGSSQENAGPLKVGSFAPNRFGLFDMGGGVAEWVADCWHPNYAGAPTDGAAWECQKGGDHVLRGGSWMSTPSIVRDSDREHYETSVRYPGNGFRVARSE